MSTVDNKIISQNAFINETQACFSRNLFMGVLMESITNKCILSCGRINRFSVLYAVNVEWSLP